jgi:hypothetical protein
MADLEFLFLVILFFAVTLATAAFFDRLMEK